MINAYSTRRVWLSTFPSTETVTLKVRQLASSDSTVTYTSYTIVHAKQRPSQLSTDHQSVGLRRKKWQMWQDALTTASAPAPKPGDQITDSDGISWLIETVAVRLFSNLFDCECAERP